MNIIYYAFTQDIQQTKQDLPNVCVARSIIYNYVIEHCTKVNLHASASYIADCIGILSYV